MNRWLARSTVGLALSALTLGANAGVLSTLLAVPWGIIYTVVSAASKPKESGPSPTRSSPAEAHINHWVLTSRGPAKQGGLATLSQLQKDFGDAIRTQIPDAQISLGTLSIPAPERTADATLTAAGWLSCREPVFEASAQTIRPDTKDVKRLHVCVTQSQEGYQTAVYAFDAERHTTRLSFGREKLAPGFMSDPEAHAPALIQQLRAALDKQFVATQTGYSGSVRATSRAPAATPSAPAHEH